MLDEILQAAQKYCEQELYIIPVKRDKTPSTPHGIKDATNDFNTFLKMYNDGYGIGLLTGTINNIYVPDCDVEKDRNKKPIIKDGKVINTGEQEFFNKFIIDANTSVFKSYTVRTQSGGLQMYYKLKEGQAPLKTHIGVLPKVDFKGDGGYVVAPPSLGPYGKYEVIVNAPIAEMPDELYDFWHDLDMPDDSNEEVTPINLNDKNINLVIKTLAYIFMHPNGIGNELLMAFAGAMALRGVAVEHTKAIIYEAATINKWPTNGFDSVIENSYKKYKNHQKILGYTTFKNDVIKNKDKYENYSEIIKNLDSVFENSESPFYDVDKHNVKHFNKGKSIKFIMSKYPCIYTDDGNNLYYFSDRDGWHSDVENEIKKLIQTTDDSISEHNINEIINGIKHLTYNKNFKNNKLPNNLIPIPSGLYNVENHTLEKHSNAYFYSNIDRNYIPGVKEESLVIDEYLNRILENPERDKIVVYEGGFAWPMLNDNNVQGMIIFYGEGGNGKGIIQNEVIKNLFGLENVAMPDLSRIANYPFELQGLIRKRALLFSESIRGVTYNWQVLKRITGHDYENIPIKNHPPILSQYQSAVILSTNELVPPKDELAIWRRIINIIEFNNYLNTLSRDEIGDIIKQLCNKDELDRLFSFVVDKIYPEFLKHGFSNRYSIKTAKEKYLMKSNPAITYLKLKEAKDQILTDPQDVLSYCRAHNYDQNKCYSIDKNGDETVFQIKELLIKQVNQFCLANHLPKYDIHDRNSQTKIGQGIHYLGLEITEYRKRMSGKLIHAWAGIFIIPDDSDLIIDNETEKTGNPDSLPEGPVKQSLMEEQELKHLEKDKNPGLSGELQVRATQKIFELLDSEYQPVHELDNIRRNLDYLSDDQFNFLIDAMIKSSIAKIDGRRLEKIKSDPEKPSALIYRKSVELATDLPIEESYTRSEWHYYAFDNAKINLESKSWIKFSMKSQEISKKEFDTMRGARQ